MFYSEFVFGNNFYRFGNFFGLEFDRVLNDLWIYKFNDKELLELNPNCRRQVNLTL